MPDAKPTGRRLTVVALACGLAAPCEGLRHVAYRDPGGVLTVCNGDTNNIDPSHFYTDAECRARLDARMTEAAAAVDRCAPGAPVGVAAAFSDAVYNLGPTIACDRKSSTAARLLFAHQWAGACEELPKWNHDRIAGILVVLPGLTSRRLLEREVCRKAVMQ